MATNSLLAILKEESTIWFLPESTKVDLTNVNTSQNPQLAPGYYYAWYLNNHKTKILITFVERLVYSGFDHKAGPYFIILVENYVGIFNFDFLRLCVIDLLS